MIFLLFPEKRFSVLMHWNKRLREQCYRSMMQVLRYRSWTLTQNKWGNINRGELGQLSLYTIDGTGRWLKVLWGQERVGWQEPIVMIHRFTLNGGWRRYLLTVLTSSASHNHVWSFLPRSINWCIEPRARSPLCSVIFGSFTCGGKRWRHSCQVHWEYDDQIIIIIVLFFAP